MVGREMNLLLDVYTLVSLLLSLDADREVLARKPFDLVTFGVVVDEITAVSTLSLVEVGLGDGLVCEEFVRGKLED